MSEQSTPAGWYPDPQNPGQQRYWDGVSWGAAAPAAGGQPAFAQPVGYGYAQGVGGEAAGFGPRLGAAIIDGLIVGVAVQIVATIFGAISDVLGLLVQLAGFVGGIYYYAYFEGGETGQTIGKKTLGIKVVDGTTGQAGIGQGRAIGRYFAKIVSAIPCYLGFFWMLWDADKQTWHDKMLTTRVVKA